MTKEQADELLTRERVADKDDYEDVLADITGCVFYYYGDNRILYDQYRNRQQQLFDLGRYMGWKR